MMILTEDHYSLSEMHDLFEAVENNDMILTEEQEEEIAESLMSRVMKNYSEISSTVASLPKRLLGVGSNAYNFYNDTIYKIKKKLEPIFKSEFAQYNRDVKLGKYETKEELEKKAESSKLTIKRIFELTANEIKFTINDLKTKDKYRFDEALLNVIILVCINTAIMSVIVGILTSIFGVPLMIGAVLGQILTAVLAAPITEEYSKKHAIENNYASEYIVTFNAFEFSLYFFQLGKSLKIFIIRMLPVLMHFATFAVQKQSLKYTESIEKPTVGSDNPRVSSLGLIQAMTIHGLWNSLAVVIHGGINLILQ